jgi:hypothetical protein
VKPLWPGLLAALGAVLGSAAAAAHQPGVSSSRVVVEPSAFTVTIDALGQDYERAAGLRLRDDASGAVNPVALAVSAPALIRYVTEHATVQAGGQGCMPTPKPPRAAGTHVSVRVVWRCPPDAPDPVYRVSLFQEVDPAARHVVLMTTAAGESEVALDANSPGVALGGAPPTALAVVWRFLVAGVEHIFMGYDHIAFLAAMVLWGRTLWPLVKVVTAFTIAHTATLALAVLGVVTPPPQLVEVLIAASIVYAAAENFWTRDVGRRWRTAFAFGLIHGFGFASVLREFGLPKGAIVPALASFNLGVEVGQIAIVLLIVPPMVLLDRAVFAPRNDSAKLVYGCSTAILLCGLYWMVQRAAI